MFEELYISVDVETAGPIPADFALLSIGACVVDNPSEAFYVELQPDRERFSDEAMAVHGLSIEILKKEGAPACEAMQAFADWVKGITNENQRPVFVALNAPFDWMFINDYFHRYLGTNPFGHSALDIKAYFMGQNGVDWGQTSMQHMSDHFLEERHLTHNALADAQDQAEIFKMIMDQSPKINRAE
ncbi:MAG: DNA polymerase III subunit epsilon [Anaerolinea sp.]|nr:DNA polymerase III subunit epsilon [Anaerolinea sp.]